MKTAALVSDKEFLTILMQTEVQAGIKDMLLAGDWPTMPPIGYDAVKINGKRTIVINARLLRQAFEWKAFDKLTNEAVRARHTEKGLKFCHQRIPEIFRNPFYCGLMAHQMESRVIHGNPQGVASREVFIR